jgi:hypothetical protein
MSDPAVGLLLERLMSPPPRVRWEVARSIAKLIRAGDRSVSQALLVWIGKRSLESEVALGLGIIQAFDLGAYFDVQAVEAAVRAQSFLSDWLIKSAFPGHAMAPGGALRFAPQARPVLPHEQKTWFDRYRTQAIAPILSREFARLDATTGLPLMERWKHEWGWLQAQQPAPAAEYPSFYSQRSREQHGQFDLGQRELYATAFLRTLNYAVAHWKMPAHIAESYSRLLLTFNRGLADLEPIARPTWSHGLTQTVVDEFADTARSILEAAKELAEPEERIIAIRVVDISDEATFEMDLRLVLASDPISAKPDDVAELINLTPTHRPGEFAGLLVPGADGHQFDFDEPYVLAQQLWPSECGRAHSEIIPEIRVASPVIMGREVELVGTPEDVRLVTAEGPLTRWIHWYSEWDATQPVAIDSCVGSVTTVRSDALKQLVFSRGLEKAWAISATFGARENTYKEFETQSRSAWLSESD